MTYTTDRANSLLSNITSEIELRELIAQLDITDTGDITVLYSDLLGDSTTKSGAVVGGMINSGIDITVLNEAEAYKFWTIIRN